MNPLLAHRLLNRAAFLGTFGKGPSTTAVDRYLAARGWADWTGRARRTYAETR
jgi:hypothetical protein